MTSVGHSLAGLSLYFIFNRKLSLLKEWKNVLFFLILANLPDLDFLPGIVSGDLNRYHHGASHSIGFCLLVGVIAAGIYKLRKNAPFINPVRNARKPVRENKISNWVKYGFISFCLCFSHILIDLFGRDTCPPYGEKLFWPFSNKYFIASFTPFGEVDHTSLMTIVLNPCNYVVVLKEIIVFIPILLGIFIFIKVKNKKCT